VADSARVLTRIVSNNGSHDMFNSSGENTSGAGLAPGAAGSFEKGPNIIYFFHSRYGQFWTLMRRTESAPAFH
jgi:hypothetical protein